MASGKVEVGTNERAGAIISGFRLYGRLLGLFRVLTVVCCIFQLCRNYMNMRDATSGKILWEAKDWTDESVFREEKIGTVIF
jgi:hypothetical protein